MSVTLATGADVSWPDPYLRIFSTADGTPLLNVSLGRPMFVPLVAIDDDLAVTGWTRGLTIYRLPPA